MLQLSLMEVFPGISTDPDVRFGKPCLSGTRIDVATIVGAFAAGESADTVAAEYALSLDQVRSYRVLRYEMFGASSKQRRVHSRAAPRPQVRVHLRQGVDRPAARLAKDLQAR